METPVGSVFTVIGVLAIVLPQPLFPVTETFPEFAPKSTSIEFVPCPDCIVEPVGTLQVYV